MIYLNSPFLSSIILTLIGLLVFILLYFFYYLYTTYFLPNKKYEKYPQLKEFENYISGLEVKMDSIKNWLELKPIISEIDNIHSRYKGQVPDQSLRMSLYQLREKFFTLKRYLGPKAD